MTPVKLITDPSKTSFKTKLTYTDLTAEIRKSRSKIENLRKKRTDNTFLFVSHWKEWKFLISKVSALFSNPYVHNKFNGHDYHWLERSFVYGNFAPKLHTKCYDWLIFLIIQWCTSSDDTKGKNSKEREKSFQHSLRISDVIIIFFPN